jgi:hypothetical protein
MLAVFIFSPIWPSPSTTLAERYFSRISVKSLDFTGDSGDTEDVWERSA